MARLAMGQGRASFLGGQVSLGEMYLAEGFSEEDLSCEYVS